MKIGIIGSGSVAQALGEGFVGLNHSVMLGTRDPSKLTKWASPLNIQVGSFADAAKFGDLAVLAVKGSVAEKALTAAGVENLHKKTLIDACNPIADTPPTDGVLHFFTGPNESLLEHLQSLAPSVHLVKGFSCIGSALMVNPKFDEGKPSMFICGNNTTAKTETASLCTALGFDVQDMGSAAAARAIEPLCMLWCIPGFKDNQWRHAFKLLK